MEKEHYTRLDLIKLLTGVHHELSDVRTTMYYAEMTDFEKYMKYKAVVKDVINNIEKVLV